MIGERLMELRKDRNLTQTDLGRELSLSKYTISSYETGKTTPSDDIKIKISEFFNVSFDYLLGLTDQPTPINNNNSEVIIRIPKVNLTQEDIQYLNYTIALILKKNQYK